MKTWQTLLIIISIITSGDFNNKTEYSIPDKKNSFPTQQYVNDSSPSSDTVHQKNITFKTEKVTKLKPTHFNLHEDFSLFFQKNKFTSGVSNSPFYVNQDSTEKTNYGFYNFYDMGTNNRNSQKAFVLVKFNSLPWRSDDQNQNILQMIVYDSIPNCVNCTFQVGNKVDTSQLRQNINYPHIYSIQKNDLMYFFHLKNNIITKWIYLDLRYSIDSIRLWEIENHFAKMI